MATNDEVRELRRLRLDVSDGTIGSVVADDCVGAAWVNSSIDAGRIAVSCIDVGATCWPDAHRSANRDALVKGLRLVASRVEVDQSQAWGRDGSARFRPEVVEALLRPDDVPMSVIRMKQAGDLAIEIGTCATSTLIERVMTSSGLVRWPYGSTVAVVLWWVGGSIMDLDACADD